MDDLAHYRAVEREPVSGTYRGHTIVSMPPPSSGGAHIIEILNILEGYPLRRAGPQFGRLAARDGGGGEARLRRSRRLARRSRLRRDPAGGPHLEGLRGEAARADLARSGAARRRDSPGRAATLRERPDHPFLDRRRRGRRRRQHLHAELALRLRPRGRRNRRPAQQRARRLRRQVGRRQLFSACSAATPMRRGR